MALLFFEKADISYSVNSQTKKDLANICHNIANYKWTNENFEQSLDKTCTLRFHIEPPQLDEPETISVLQPTEFYNNGQPKIPTPWVLFALRNSFFENNF